MIHLVGKPEGGSDARSGPDDEQPFQVRGLGEPGSGPAPAPAYPRDREPGFGSSVAGVRATVFAREASLDPAGEAVPGRAAVSILCGGPHCTQRCGCIFSLTQTYMLIWFVTANTFLTPPAYQMPLLSRFP